MKMRKRSRLRKGIVFVAAAIILLIIVLFLIANGTPSISKKEGSVTFLTDTGEINIKVEIADTPIKHSKGLMSRTSLDYYYGMLFVFEDEAERGFWMKDTYVHLDIIFIDKDFKILNIVENVQPCVVNPCEIYYSEYPIKYVVEVNSGFSSKEGIEIGDTIRFINE